jgi:hypothetical protein
VDPLHNQRFQAAEHAILEEKRRRRSLRSSSKDNNGSASSVGSVKHTLDDDRSSVIQNMLHKLKNKYPAITREDARMYVHVWSVVRALKRNDPAHSVQRIAMALVKYVRSMMVEQLKIRGVSHSSSSTGTTSSGLESPRLRGLKAGSSIKTVGSVGNNLGKRIDTQKLTSGSLDPKARHLRPGIVGSAQVSIRKHVTSSGSSNSSGGGGLDVTKAAVAATKQTNESVDDILRKKIPDLISPLLDLMCKKGASISLLRTSGEEDDPMSERGALLRYRRDRNRSIVKTAASIVRARDQNRRRKFKQSSILDNASIMSSVLLFHP